MSDTTLKDCPLCGSAAKMLTWSKAGTEFMTWGQIVCTNSVCGCTLPAWNDIRTGSRMDVDGEQTSIRKWNERDMTTLDLSRMRIKLKTLIGYGDRIEAGRKMDELLDEIEQVRNK